MTSFTHFSSSSFIRFFWLIFPILLSLPRSHSLALDGLIRRQDGPFFPDQPPSCPICAQSFPSINSCCQAAPVFANFSMIIFNPGAFIDVIECACTDTFQSAYPQCVDCFIQTNQTSFLNTDANSTPGIISGIRNVCAIASVLLGGVATADGEVTPTSSIAVPSPTASTSAAESMKLGIGLALASKVMEGVILAVVLGTGVAMF